MRRLIVALLLGALLTPTVSLLGGPTAASARSFDETIEDYAGYEPQKKCRTQPRAGTRQLAAWINRKFDGGYARAYNRSCSSGGTSEHKDGRAIDWTMNASRKADRREVARFIKLVSASDEFGNPHALARRMGLMYWIWNDQMWRSYARFEAGPYKPCKPVRSCSKTARHRDHVHISLSRQGAKAETSWYLPPVESQDPS